MIFLKSSFIESRLFRRLNWVGVGWVKQILLFVVMNT